MLPFIPGEAARAPAFLTPVVVTDPPTDRLSIGRGRGSDEDIDFDTVPGIRTSM